MNEAVLKQVIGNYIKKFDYFNGTKHHECFKWVAAKKFRPLMDEALSKTGPEFAKALYQVRKASDTIIDNHQQPFYAMVKFARQEPETVRQMFLDLYAVDSSDLAEVGRMIGTFYDRSNRLLEKYEPGKWYYKQDFRSIMGYLFFYDPDHYYMYKATQSKTFAKYMEFGDGWGNGIQIKLDVYYRMCDWALEQIKNSPELLAIDKSRFDFPDGAEMAPDLEKHILLFDLIYCADVYDLYPYRPNPMPNPKPNPKPNLAEMAKELLEKYEVALNELHRLEDAMFLIQTHLTPGTEIFYRSGKKATVLSCDEKGAIKVVFGSGKKLKVSAPYLLKSGEIKTKDGALEKELREYLPVLRKEKGVLLQKAYNAAKALEPYKEYLENLVDK